MIPDMYLVLGLMVAAFSIPSIISAIADGRAPRVSVFTTVIAGGLILRAVMTEPGGYTVQEIPHVFVRVLARFIS